MTDSTTIRKALAALRSENPYERIAGIDVLAKLRYAEAAERIAAMLVDSSRDVQEAAAWALGDIGSPAATEYLIDIAYDPGAPRGMRWAAIHALGMIGDLSALGGLFEIFYTDDDSELRHAAGRAVLRYGQNAVPMLIHFLDSDEAAARMAAVRLLGRLRARGAISSLMHTVTEDVPHVRWDAIKALGDIGSAVAVPLLLTILKQDDVVLGKVAVWALEMINTPEAIAAARQWRARHRYTDHHHGDAPLFPPPRPGPDGTY